ANGLAGDEMMGVALATVMVAALGHRINWRVQLGVALAVAVIGNLMSAAMVASPMLGAGRFIAGLGHGAIIGLSFTFIGLTTRIARNLALYLLLLLAYGALGIWFLPALLDAIGFKGLFLGFAALTMAGFLTIASVPRTADERVEPNPHALQLGALWQIAALGALLAYNLAMGIAWANLELIGTHAGIPDSQAGFALGISQIMAVGGALVAVFLAEKLGRWGPIALGILGGNFCIALLLGKPGYTLFLGAVCGLNILWNFVLPFILSAVSDCDTSGHMMTRAISLQMIGLGFGPIVAGAMLGNNGYGTILSLCMALFILSYALLLTVMFVHRKALAKRQSLR
ncbi:MAG: MFS transporter, partial [Alphaproteobacteria bacterium]|nr:MFS transporter [Alphaproteobacteria bacterium]